MSTRVVLDSAAFDLFDSPAHAAWAVIERVLRDRDGELCAAAVTVAEVCRGTARTRRVEAILARLHGGHRVIVVPTDIPMAKAVGRILHESRSDSDMLADAHVVAAGAGAVSAVVVTSDPDDISRLAGAARGSRIVVHAIR